MRQIIPLFSHLNQAVFFSKGNAPLYKLFQNHFKQPPFCDKTCFAKFFFVTCRKIQAFLKRAFAKPAWSMDKG